MIGNIMKSKKIITAWQLLMYLLFFLSAIGPSSLFTQDTDYIQNVKAVFLYNFTQYINWTEQDSSQVFTIAVFGQSRILDPLKQIALKRLVRQKKIQVKHYNKINQINHCHILYIPESEKGQLKRIINQVKRGNILLVSEIEGALSSGIMINLIILQKTIKFEINLQAMKKSGFQPSSELLKLAVRIIE